MNRRQEIAISWRRFGFPRRRPEIGISTYGVPI